MSNPSARTLRIATRKSDLALWQANWVKAQLAALGHEAELVLIDTQGDRSQQDGTPFRLLPGQGFFTKAIQDALIDDQADIAVHSHKDLPSARMEGLDLAAISAREDPRDVLLISPAAFEASAPTLPVKQGAVIGTSAARRQAQLKALRPDVNVQELRGNVPTRLRKLREGHYDAILLAAAGLSRLHLDTSGLNPQPLAPEVFVPAPAQGALALEIRREDYDLASLLTNLHDPASAKAVSAERGLMAMLQGGCQLALGAYAELADSTIKLTAWYEGKRVEVENPSSEGAAMLAYEALGRPAPAHKQEQPA